MPLTKGRFALVDDADFEWLNQWKWGCHVMGYAVRTEQVSKINGKRKQIGVFMHRQISMPGDGLEIDHINGNKLDNRRENLRVCTRSDNGRNRQKFSSATTSVYKGVYWAKTRNRWYAGIKYNGKSRHLGSFKNEDDAAKAYNIAAINLFGEFACLNVLANNTEMPDTTNKGGIDAANLQKGEPHGPAV